MHHIESLHNDFRIAGHLQNLVVTKPSHRDSKHGPFCFRVLSSTRIQSTEMTEAFNIAEDLLSHSSMHGSMSAMTAVSLLLTKMVIIGKISVLIY